MCLLVVMFQELRNAHSEEIMGIRREEEMEMSDDDSDENPCKRMRTGENGMKDRRQCRVSVHQCFRSCLGSFSLLFLTFVSAAVCPQTDGVSLLS